MGYLYWLGGTLLVSVVFWIFFQTVYEIRKFKMSKIISFILIYFSLIVFKLILKERLYNSRKEDFAIALAVLLVIIFLNSLMYLAGIINRMLWNLFIFVAYGMCNRIAFYIFESNSKVQYWLSIGEAEFKPKLFEQFEIDIVIALMMVAIVVTGIVVIKKPMGRYSFFLLLTPFLTVLFGLHPDVIFLNVILPKTYTIMVMVLFIVNISNYILASTIRGEIRTKTENSSLKNQIEIQQNNYTQLSRSYKSIRSFLHDIQKHIYYINGCVEQNKSEEIIPYTQHMMKDLEKRYCKINTGHLVIDSLVSNLLSKAEENCIQVTYSFDLDANNVPLEDYHFAIILGNLLDNAYNECVKQENGYIDIKIHNLEEKFAIHIVNTISKKGSVREEKDSKLEHGYGMENIKKTVDLYGGIYNSICENDTYSATVLVWNKP